MQIKRDNFQNWKDEYQRKLVSAEEAVKAVKSGDRVFFSFARDPFLLCQALAERHAELKNVSVNMMMAQTDPGWFEPEKAAAFQVTVGIFSGPMARDWLAERKVDFLPHTFSMESKIFERPEEARPWDVFMTVVSPPDEQGYVSFGYTMWNKKRLAQTAGTVIAEVDKSAIRTGGDNFIHVSQIDYFVENTQPILLNSEINEAVSGVEDEAMREKMISILEVVDPIRRLDYRRFMDGITMEDLEKAAARLGAGTPAPEMMNLAENVASLIKDGDTIQIGMGRPSARLASWGVLMTKGILESTRK